MTKSWFHQSSVEYSAIGYKLKISTYLSCNEENIWVEFGLPSHVNATSKKFDLYKKFLTFKISLDREENIWVEFRLSSQANSTSQKCLLYKVSAA